MKSKILIIFSLFIIAGCGAIEPSSIKTEGNIFSSSQNPSVLVELHKNFKNLGNINKPFWLDWTYDSTPITVKVERKMYLYGQISKDNYLKRLVIVNILELPVGKNWHPNTMSVVKYPLKESIVDYEGKNFQYCIKPQRAVTRLTAEYLLDKGIITPKCYMWMFIGRVFGSNIKMYISLYEDISNFNDFGVDSCEDWYDMEMLNDKQKEYLEEFEKKALSNINIIQNN